MNIALYGRTLTNGFGNCIQQLINILEQSNCGIYVYEPFAEVIKKIVHFKYPVTTFTKHREICNNVSYVFSIGGDGTLLNTITLVKDSGIPVMGINTGRLGFLASISKEEVPAAVKAVLNKDFIVEKRSLLQLTMEENLFGKLNFALNELSVRKKDSSSMISINVYVNDEYLNSYWADGLIVATPTGSTAYSLSCGGPIISPDSENFIITPISSHNLTVRPVVIPDKYTIRLKISDERNRKFLVSLDSRTQTIDNETELYITKSDFFFNLIKLKNESFFSTIRNKLMWGIDKRN
ncbi:MAG TPA: NAD kinase [Bacteroidales bacterium]|nr:NAD kinase [Bacteroidales bacterium]HPS16088.1 NAD kinase [Bacteroidales bacterium]